MAFLTTLAADVCSGTFRKLLPWGLFLLATIGLGAAFVMRSAQLEAARATLEAVRHDDEMAKADILRWSNATARMQKIIDAQAEQLKHQAADLAAARQVANENAKTRAAQVNLLNSQLQSLKARANAHPADIRPLGPIVTDVLGSLRRDIDSQSAAPSAAD